MLTPYLSSSQLNDLTGQFSNLFSQYGSGINNYISVVKSPIRIVNNPAEQVLAGYGAENMNIQDVTYQTVTGVSPAVIIFPKALESSQFGQLKFELDENQVMIKVESQTADYLTTDKTERIVIDGTDYNMSLVLRIQNFFGLKYYYFKLTSTK